MDWNCNQIRGKIRTFVSNSDMTVKKFCQEIDVSDNSYYNFLHQSGPNAGISSETYMGAACFFKKRELAGLSMPCKKAKTASTSAGGSKGDKPAPKTNKDDFDVSGIDLPGQDTDSVPIYDTCDDIRKKMSAHLRDTSATQAGFLRQLSAQYAEPPSSGLGASSLRTFQSHSGASAASKMPIFYPAYVYFEKLRIKQGKPKTKKRQEMEKVWGANGMEKLDLTGGVLMKDGDTIWTDQFGHIEFGRGKKAIEEPKQKKDMPESKWRQWSMKRC